ncbi:hypothetical protein BN2476_2120004 [Paraburkholderia piptadeniae]|uniref:Uncharacterized protein n=1 Tax=Paraburkholderia piptadeniae TaxID=1701573 RepID=A0A1N7SXS2_9BURK|nr:hypothetical protein BN2476_2120004 [Paraburkholderia piptadeniae]
MAALLICRAQSRLARPANRVKPLADHVPARFQMTKRRYFRQRAALAITGETEDVNQLHALRRAALTRRAKPAPNMSHLRRMVS